jgi:hypothetical protein
MVDQKQVAENILTEIDAYCVETYGDGHRNHLGASLIGNECKRYLWYVFRWCFKENFDGRIYRLFNRGHREEERFINYLEGIGCKVYSDDLTNFKLILHQGGDYEIIENSALDEIPLTSENVSENPIHIKMAKACGVKFPQYRISGVMGHFGGSLDGAIILPERFGINEPILGEYKTNGTGSGFNDLTKKGMKLAKPVHFAQINTYGNKLGFKYCLYIVANKNDDSLYVELVKLDHNQGKQMEAKAENVILSQEPPSRLSNSSTFYKCKYCNAHDVCHGGKVVDKNCRSCANARPVEGGQWECRLYGIIPKDAIKTGCPNDYTSIAVSK